jgi:heme A synthase
VNTFLLVAALTLTAWWASGGQALRWRGHGRLAAVLATGLAGVLLLGVSGAITALGDTLFPVATLAEGKAQTFSDSAHLFVRLRIWHPTMAVAVGGWIVITALAAARGGNAAVRRAAIALIGLYAAQLVLGLLNVALLAPVSLQLAHLLLSDLIWIDLVVLSAGALGESAAEVGISPVGARSAAERQARPRHRVGAPSGGPTGDPPASRRIRERTT